MADPTNVIQHDFGFPWIVRAEMAEREALYAMLVSLGATKLVAERLMEDYPRHRTAAQAIIDFASDGEGDIRGAIAELEEEEAPRRWRGGVIRPRSPCEPLFIREMKEGRQRTADHRVVAAGSSR